MLIDKLREISSLCHDIRNSDLDAEKQYDIIFSQHISRFVFELCHENGTALDYYDPDTSYEEDMDAFIYALDDKISSLNQDILNGDSNENDFIQRAKQLKN